MQRSGLVAIHAQPPGSGHAERPRASHPARSNCARRAAAIAAHARLRRGERQLRGVTRRCVGRSGGFGLDYCARRRDGRSAPRRRRRDGGPGDRKAGGVRPSYGHIAGRQSENAQQEKTMANPTSTGRLSMRSRLPGVARTQDPLPVGPDGILGGVLLLAAHRRGVPSPICTGSRCGGRST